MLKGCIINILTQKENDWGRYKLDVDGKELLAVGVIKDAAVGMNVVLEGSEEDTKYGHQFKISSVLSTEADDMAGVRRFLTDGYVKGLGKTKANAIIEAFGKDSLDLFESEEGRKRLTTIKGLGAKSIEKITESYEENKKYKDIVLFLCGSGTKNQVEKIYEKYGDNAKKLLTENPYRIQLDIEGFGFKKTDAIAVAGGVRLDSKERIMAGVKYVIDEASTSKGNCYLTLEEIKAELLPLLTSVKEFYDNKAISKKVVENALNDWPSNREKFIDNHDPSAETLAEIDNIAETRRLICDSLVDVVLDAIEEKILVNDNGNIYTQKMYKTESKVAELIAKLCHSNPVRYASAELIERSIKQVEERKTKELNNSGIHGNFLITKEQRDSVYLSLMHRISIVSGGPGRGKTAITEIIAHGFMSCGKYYNEKDIIMLAPTGRAAQRITESTGYDAMTAQRAVLSVKNGNEQPIGKLVVIDESSMVDIYLALSVLEYASECNIVFVGDVDQIASVGPGKVLKDMIDSGIVPCILLKEGHRNTGTIARNSELINAGMKIDRYCYDEHFVYTPCNVDNIADIMIADYKKAVEKYGIQNVMLCTAMRERGAVAVNKLNKALQEAYTSGNDTAYFGEGKMFRVGDRVMQTKNDYSFVIKRKGVEDTGIFNGEKGTVNKVIYDPEEESYKIVVIFDDGSIGGYTKNTICNLTLAYATTLHKCQGSEAACMMMAYTFGDYMLLNRSLFYTGETRAKKEFRFYGEEKFQYGKMLSAFDMAVGKVDDAKRNTMLAQRIEKIAMGE